MNQILIIVKNKFIKIITISFICILLAVISVIFFMNNNIIESQESSLSRALKGDYPNLFLKENSDKLKSLENIQFAFRNITKNIMPSIVEIISESNINFRDDYILKQFLGTGFIISEDGYIITSLHLIENSNNIRVKLFESDEIYKAEVIGSDKQLDISLLKIETKKKLQAVSMGDSNTVKPGDITLSAGNPISLSYSINLGIVSAVNRKVELWGSHHNRYYIQTNAMLNTGCSGGPLLNIYGQVIGINTSILTVGTESYGISFAVPINFVKKSVQNIVMGVENKYLSLGILFVDDIITMVPGLGYFNEGLFITGAFKNSSAYKLGIKYGDILLSVNDKKVSSKGNLESILLDYNIGDNINIKLNRNDEIISFLIKLEDKNKFINSNTTNFLGLIVEDVENATFTSNNYNEGVIVIGIEKDSSADRGSIKLGDIILEIDYNTINNIEDYNNVISHLKKNVSNYTIKLMRIENMRHFNKIISLENT